MEIAVELKTGKIYRGVLSNAENDMTVTLQRATTTTAVAETTTMSIHPTTTAVTDTSTRVDDADKQPYTQLLPMLQIRGSQIRYIHFIEPNVDLALAVKQGMERERAALQKYKRGIRK
jgi:small nuclear ribonucleoprotein (snRNP)-like protein